MKLLKIKKPSVRSLKNLGFRGKKTAAPEAGEDVRVVEVVDPVMEARDADEGALDTPHEETSSLQKDTNQSQELVRAAEDYNNREDDDSVKTEPSNEGTFDKPAEKSLSILREETEDEETVEKEEPVAAIPRDEGTKDDALYTAPDKSSIHGTVDEDASFETRDTPYSNKGLPSPTNTIPLCGLNIPSCFT